MQIALNDRQLNAKAEFDAFAEREVMPLAQRHDQEERIAPEVIRKVAQAGYLGALVPREYGGTELDMVTVGILNESIGRACAAVRSLLTVHGMATLGISRWGSDEQKERWLPSLAAGEAIGAFALTEPRAGSDAQGITATAELHGDHYVLNGTKKWTTMGQIADLFILFAKCEGQHTAFLVERSSPGFSAKPITGMMGARGSMLAELTLENCRVPAANVLGQVGTGWSHVGLTCLDYGRYSIAFGCVGLGQACLDSSLSYANSRRQFGKLLGTNQLIQKMLTEMVVQVQAARLLCYEAGYFKDIADPDSIMKTWIAKYFASTMLTKVAADAVQIHGANGCHNGHPVERYFRESKVNEIVEGTSQMHEVLIANHALRSI